MKKQLTAREVQVANAHAALKNARLNFYKNRANSNQQFNHSFLDFLPKDFYSAK